MKRPHAAARAVVVTALGLLVLTGCTAAPPPAAQDVGPPAVVTTPGPPPPPGPTGPPAVGVSSPAPVPVGEAAAFGEGLVATVLTIEPVQVDARGPGEIAGSGAAVTLELVNDGTAPVDLGGIAVNAYFDDAVPATGNSAPPAAPVSGDLQPGDSRQGVYLFQLPAASIGSVVVEINYSGSPNVVLIRR